MTQPEMTESKLGARRVAAAGVEGLEGGRRGCRVCGGDPVNDQGIGRSHASSRKMTD